MDKTEVSTGNCIALNAALLASASTVGGKEREGPLGELFDLCDPEDLFGGRTWEEAESEMQRKTFNLVLARAGRRDSDVGALFAGDLLNQCVGSAYGLLSFDIPYFGLYGACSTCAESLLLASISVTHGVFGLCGAVTSSHFCAAERQFRTPIEYGAQRAPSAQWTVTGAGAFLLTRASRGGDRPVIRRGIAGRVIDMGVRDAANMGAAMAPAAADTLCRFFRETGERPDSYDAIVTGDLGFEGGTILCDLLRAEGILIGENYTDCGQLIYDRERQDVHGGGSGCGCSAVVLASYLCPRLASGELNNILIVGTGAMMSPASIQQGQAIPAVAHLLRLCSKKEKRR